MHRMYGRENPKQKQTYFMENLVCFHWQLWEQYDMQNKFYLHVVIVIVDFRFAHILSLTTVCTVYNRNVCSSTHFSSMLERKQQQKAKLNKK